MLIGHQSIKKSPSLAHTDPNYDVNKGDYVVIYMVLIRLSNVGSEILITLNEPITHPRVSVTYTIRLYIHIDYYVYTTYVYYAPLYMYILYNRTVLL